VVNDEIPVAVVTTAIATSFRDPDVSAVAVRAVADFLPLF